MPAKFTIAKPQKFNISELASQLKSHYKCSSSIFTLFTSSYHELSDADGNIIITFQETSINLLVTITDNYQKLINFIFSQKNSQQLELLWQAINSESINSNLMIKGLYYDQRFFENYNAIAQALKLEMINSKGNCFGYNKMYLFHRNRGLLDKFYNYIAFINALTKHSINLLISQYKDNNNLNVITGLGIQPTSFNDILIFFQTLKKLQDTQEKPFKDIGMDWDASVSFTCKSFDLSSLFSLCKLGKINQQILVSLYKNDNDNNHSLVIESKQTGDIGITNANTPTKTIWVKTIDDAAWYINHHNNIAINAEIGIGLLYGSYGDQTFDLMLKKHESVIKSKPDYQLLFKDYTDGKISRLALAKRLYKKNHSSLIDFINDLSAYIKEQEKNIPSFQKLLTASSQHISTSNLSAQALWLELAIRCMEFDTVEELMRNNKANINSLSKGRGLLEHTYFDKKSWEMIQILIESGVDVCAYGAKDGTTILHAMVQKNDQVMLELLLNFGKSLQLLTIVNKFGNTLLHDAVHVYDNNLSMIQFLIEHGLNVNACNTSNQSILHYAATKSLELVKFLISKGAKTDVVDNAKLSISAWAASAGKHDIVNFLAEQQHPTSFSSPTNRCN